MEGGTPNNRKSNLNMKQYNWIILKIYNYITMNWIRNNEKWPLNTKIYESYQSYQSYESYLLSVCNKIIDFTDSHLTFGCFLTFRKISWLLLIRFYFWLLGTILYMWTKGVLILLGRNIMVSHNGLPQAVFLAKTSRILFSVIIWYTQAFYYLSVKVQLYVKNFVVKFTKINKDDHY